MTLGQSFVHCMFCVLDGGRLLICFACGGGVCGELLMCLQGDEDSQLLEFLG